MGNRLSKIYTRTGDDGSTGLGDGTRVSKDSARVVDGERADRLGEDLARLGGGALGGAVHAEHELVHLRAVAQRPQPPLQRTEPVRHRDADGLVREVAVEPAGELHGIPGGHLQRLAERGGDPRVGEPGGRRGQPERSPELVELSEDRPRGGEHGGGRDDTGEDQRLAHATPPSVAPSRSRRARTPPGGRGWRRTPDPG